MADFRTPDKSSWCPGCGDFGVLAAIQKACGNQGYEPHETVMVTGIGCSGKLNAYFNAYGFHGVHGRATALASGVKLANHKLHVLIAGGDGDGYGIGLNHLIHSLRRNIDMTYLVMDNHIYGLTTGQVSPTSTKGFKTKTTPAGSIEEPLKPLELALTAGATFVAQGFAGEPAQLIRLIEEGLKHRGFSLINIFSPCVTFNKVNTFEHYRESLYDLDGDDQYDPSNRTAAISKVMELGGQCRGIVYQEQGKPSYDQIYYGDGPAAVELPLALSPSQFAEILQPFR